MASSFPSFGTDFVINIAPGHISGINNLVKKIVRRFKTPTGCLYWDSAYGLDLRQYLNSTVTTSGLTQIKNLVKAQCELDPRVKNADVSVSNSANNELFVTIQITTQPGPTFVLILKVNQLTVDLLSNSNPQ